MTNLFGPFRLFKTIETKNKKYPYLSKICLESKNRRNSRNFLELHLSDSHIY